MTNTRITLRQQLTGLAFTSPYIVGVSIFLLFALLMSLYFSFTDYPILNPPMWIGLDNYIKLLGFHTDPSTGHAVANDPIFYQVLRNTLIFAALSVPLSLTVSVLLAILLNQAVVARAFFRTVIFLPSLVPSAAAAMLWLWVLNGQQGLLNVVIAKPYALAVTLLNHLLYSDPANYLSTLPPNWLGEEALIKPVFIFLGLYGIGHAVVIFLAGLQDIPTELYEAASIDGASTFQRLRHITLPMLSPVIFFNLIMGIIGAFQVFDLPYIIVGTGINRAGYFYSQYLFDKAFMDQQMGYAAAMAWIQFAIILALTSLVIWTSKRWVHYR